MVRLYSMSLRLAAVSVAIGMLVPTLAFAEAGSVGGTVGKQNKSLSGDLGEQTPHKFAKPPAGKSLPRTRTNDKNDPCDSGTLFAACH